MPGRNNLKEIPKEIIYSYIFEPDSGARKEFTIILDGLTLNRIDKGKHPRPRWATLKYMQCDNCPFDAGRQTYCPIATGLVDIIETFKDVVSYSKGLVTVLTPERTISKRITMQEGISSLIGIYMVTAGCPIMKKLKPMVRYHQPFASINETIYRASSMYLLGQYFIKKHGKHPDWSLNKLIQIYKEIEILNQATSKRIRLASDEDASLNALVILDIFAISLPFSIEHTLEELEYLYASYLK